MLTRGYAKHPCTQLVHLQGVVVGRVERYPLMIRLYRGYREGYLYSSRFRFSDVNQAIL